MMFEVLLTTDSKTYDISELVSAVSFTDNIDKAGICTFSVKYNTTVTPAEGNAVRIKADGVTYFAGYIFKVSRSQARQVKVTAYEMCLKAVKQCGERLCDVPTRFMTDEILIAAMQRYHHLLYWENWGLWVWGKIGEERSKEIVSKLQSFTEEEFVVTPFCSEYIGRYCTSSFKQCQNFIQEMTARDTFQQQGNLYKEPSDKIK